MLGFIIGNEKAVLGGLTAFVLALVGQLGVTGQMTVKEAVYAVLTWVITHLVVWATTNTKGRTVVNSVVSAAPAVGDGSNNGGAI